MKIIIDSGGTKADWRLVSRTGSIIKTQTPGFSPLHQDASYLEGILGQLPQSRELVQTVYYYGTGIHSSEVRDTMIAILKDSFRADEVFVESDLLGACRATAGFKPGIVGILGTGSSTCFFDGRKIRTQVPSLGYILRDEGSGCAIGSTLIKSYFYNEMPQELREEFQAEYKLTRNKLLSSVYGQPAANSYLASFANFAVSRQDDSYIRTMLNLELTQLIDRHLMQYSDKLTFPCHFVGSVAWLLRDLLTEILNSRGLKVGKILRKPIDELVAFHLKK
ncbi:MAG TPA: hypothetical protein PK076_00730 [Saprospiraceae bacterium]|nr:hypothetical protein [Saprospiraceae bacterium]